MLEGDLGTDKSNQTGSNNAAQYAQNDHRSDTLCQQIGYQNLGSETYYATLAGAALAVVKAIRLSSFPFNCGGICPPFFLRQSSYRSFKVTISIIIEASSRLG